MSHLKKCNTNKCLPASRNQSLPSFRPAGQAHGTSPSEIRPDGPWAGRLTFVEDFTREHSLPGLRITAIEISSSF